MTLVQGIWFAGRIALFAASFILLYAAGKPKAHRQNPSKPLGPKLLDTHEYPTKVRDGAIARAHRKETRAKKTSKRGHHGKNL